MIYQDNLDKGALEKYAAALNARTKASGAKGRLKAPDLRSRILESGGRCEWCGVGLLGKEFELDHVVSLRQRGSNSPANLVVACRDCNRRKGQKHPTRFAAEIYSETGQKTQLVARIFGQFGVAPAQQKALFAESRRDSPSQLENEEDLPQIPPYRWAD